MATAPHSVRNSEGESRRLANLRPWRKGESGNPGGRPKGESISAALRRLLAEGNTADEIAQIILGKAREGDIDYMRLLLDRAEGSVMKHIELSARPASEMTDAELTASLAQAYMDEHSGELPALEQPAAPLLECTVTTKPHFAAAMEPTA